MDQVTTNIPSPLSHKTDNELKEIKTVINLIANVKNDSTHPITSGIPEKLINPNGNNNNNNNNNDNDNDNDNEKSTIKKIGSIPNIKLLNISKQQPIIVNNDLEIKMKSNQIFSSQQQQRLKQRSYHNVKVKSLQVGPSSFKKICMLGRGDVGRVYMVKEKNTDKIYAMKVLSKRVVVKRNKIKRALAEQEILKTSNHPFIVPLYHCFQSYDHLYFVMEYCSTEFFKALQLRPGKCLNENDARFYAAEVTDALDYLHSKGFVYRDLKPENILLRENGHIMLSDFDLSKGLNSLDQQTTVSKSDNLQLPFCIDIRNNNYANNVRTNSFVGTEEYIAPEVLKGWGHTYALDWWTLGILIYEMLYAKTPFKGKNRNDTFNHILESDVIFQPQPVPYEVCPSDDCCNFICGLLEKDERKRLGSITDASDLKAHPFFKSINFALLGYLEPPILPLSSASDSSYTMTGRNMKESISLDLESDKVFDNPANNASSSKSKIQSYYFNPFEDFTSISLYHDGDSDSDS